METSIFITPEEAADYEEYKRRKRILELRGKLRGLEPTLIRRNANLAEIKTLCEQAKRLSSVCVCVQPVYVKQCSILLKNSGVNVSCIIGGNGESLLKTKIYETKLAIRDGATEFEFLPSITYLTNGNYPYFKREVRKIVRLARGKIVKLLLEAPVMDREVFLRAAQIAVETGIKFICVKADEELVLLLQDKLKNKCEIKAWGVETPQCFQDMLSLGCVRVGSELAEDITHAMENEVNGIVNPVMDSQEIKKPC